MPRLILKSILRFACDTGRRPANARKAPCKGAGRRAHTTRPSQTAKGIVSREQLIAAISSERHGHMLSGESAKATSEQGIVTLWLIYLAKYSRQHIACFIKIQDLTSMIGPEKLRRAPRIGGLVEAWFGKSDTKVRSRSAPTCLAAKPPPRWSRFRR